METDFVVIGSGLAGLTSALVLKDFGEVLLLTKGNLADCSTNLAQGGIAAVTASNDSFSSHIQDTLVAGANHNDIKAVKFLVEQAPTAIKWFESQGVVFDKKNGDYDPGQEAAHSYKRVVHSTDFTGREIEEALLSAVNKQKSIKIIEKSFAKDLIIEHRRCLGVSFIINGRLENCFCRAVMLATGGLGQIYQWTTNPDVASGDGIAIAYRAGAEIADIEFVQFHPTALKSDKSPLFLLSEALRGEGAYIKKFKIQNSKFKIRKGIRFLHDYDKRGELAPRDIVARAIFEEQKKGFETFLDIRHKGKEFLLKRFPNIYKELKKRGFDLSCNLIPVTPAAHYSCGGVKVDLFGRTSVPNLFAFGEVCSSGVHGANRLASNSLLEAVVFPLQLPHIIKSRIYVDNFGLGSHCDPPAGGEAIPSGSPRLLRSLGMTSMKETLQKIMWEKVGIIRSMKGLEEALQQIKDMEKELSEKNLINEKGIKMKNMLTVAELIIQAALVRNESLGAHFMADKPR